MARLQYQPNRLLTTDPNSTVFKGWIQKLWDWIVQTTGLKPLSTASFTVTTNFFHPVDTTSGVVTVTLPYAIGIAGRPVLVKRTAGANNVTIAAQSTDTIDGSASVNIGTTGDSAWFISDGNTKWYQISFGAGGGGGAPTDATYVVMSLNAGLSAERRLQVNSSLTMVDGGANADVTLSVTNPYPGFDWGKFIAGTQGFGMTR